MLTKNQIKKTSRFMNQTCDRDQTFLASVDKKHVIKITKRMRKIMKRLNKI